MIIVIILIIYVIDINDACRFNKEMGGIELSLWALDSFAVNKLVSRRI